MKTITIISVACIVLHYLGFFRNLLNACRMDGDRPQRKQAADIQQPADNREKLETEASYILEMQGKNPRTVSTMGDEMLTAIIKDYLIAKEIL